MSVDFRVNPRDPEEPPQQYKFYRLAFVDGSTRDYPFAWDDDDADETPARNTATWLMFEHLFNGTMPNTPQATRIVTVWRGVAGTQPTPGNTIT